MLTITLLGLSWAKLAIPGLSCATFSTMRELQEDFFFKDFLPLQYCTKFYNIVKGV